MKGWTEGLDERSGRKAWMKGLTEGLDEDPSRRTPEGRRVALSTRVSHNTTSTDSPQLYSMPPTSSLPPFMVCGVVGRLVTLLSLGGWYNLVQIVLEFRACIAVGLSIFGSAHWKDGRERESLASATFTGGAVDRRDEDTKGHNEVNKEGKSNPDDERGRRWRGDDDGEEAAAVVVYGGGGGGSGMVTAVLCGVRVWVRRVVAWRWRVGGDDEGDADSGDGGGWNGRRWNLGGGGSEGEGHVDLAEKFFGGQKTYMGGAGI
ncbi:hypothetical protein Tco_1568470 [Tanacetum coccineum]